MASAVIECWRGTVEELLDPVGALAQTVTGSRSTLTEALISWVDGSQSRATDNDALRALIASRPLEDVLAIRAEVRSEGEPRRRGVLVARKAIPGIHVSVEAHDGASALGAAEMVFQRMMIGYVDRMGGYRGLVWMLIALAPVFLTSLVFGNSQMNLTVKVLVLVVAIAGGFGAFAASYPALLVSVPLSLVAEMPPRFTERWWATVITLYRHRYTRSALATIAALTLGIIGNKIADLIPFP